MKQRLVTDQDRLDARYRHNRKEDRLCASAEAPDDGSPGADCYPVVLLCAAEEERVPLLSPHDEGDQR